MERRWACIVLVGSIGAACSGCKSQGGKRPAAAMIEDLDHVVSAETKTAALSAGPVPFPPEPPPRLAPGEAQPLAMLADVEAAARPVDLGERRRFAEPRPAAGRLGGREQSKR